MVIDLHEDEEDSKQIFSYEWKILPELHEVLEMTFFVELPIKQKNG